MKIYKLPQLAENEAGEEFCLGRKQLGGLSVQLRYGRLRPGEVGHRLSPSQDAEEIFFVVSGRLSISIPGTDFTVSDGEAFLLKNETTLVLNNNDKSEAVYIIAGAINDVEYEEAKSETGSNDETEQAPDTHQ